MSAIIKLNDHPQLLSIFRNIFPSYRKRDVIIFPQDRVTTQGTSWSGGSKNYYSKYSIAIKSHNSINAPSTPAEFGGGSDITTELDDDTIVFSGGTFRGKPSCMTVYANASVLEDLGVEA